MSDSVWHFLMFAGSIAILVVYPDIHVQPCAISGGNNLAGLKVTLYLCHRKDEKKVRNQKPVVSNARSCTTFGYG